MAAMNRRSFIKAAAGGAMAMAGLTDVARGAQEKRKPNVLMIAVDDLNDWIGPLGGHPQAKTPSLDRLAQRGYVFENANCPAPICNPARASLLTGKHPANTGLYFLAPLFRDTPTLADAITLPQHFRQNGYRTMAVGKVFHHINDADSLDEDGRLAHQYGPQPKEKLSYPYGHPLWDWGEFPPAGKRTPDDRIADWAIEQLGKQYDKPFFLSAGFIRPHVPMYAPKKWFDLYPPDSITMPNVPDDGDRISPYARKLTHAHTAPRHETVKKLGQWKHAVRSYLASISYMDDHVGRILNALDASEHARDTIIVFWADHGFHLGEKQRWGKRSLWSESARVPLIMAGPGIKPGRTDQPVGTIDIYPTLTELCGLPARNNLDGHNLQPLLANPNTDWPHAAITTFGPNNHSVRTQRWRYISYADGTHELYDHRADPNEWQNLADDPTYAAVVAEHRAKLPEVNAPLVPNSAGSDSPLFS